MVGWSEAATLPVPGAALYYEVAGSGPLLLLIPGGPQDAGVFAELSGALADRYRVVAYDPRGNSRSRVDGAATELDLDQQADDAAALIHALGGGRPAHVFGTSGGAQIGLNLAARHPDLVATLIAHEPPTVMLLDDPSEAIAANETILETYRSDGVDAAMAVFFGMNDLDEGDAPPEGAGGFEPSPEEAETFGRVSGNFAYWLEHGMTALSMYEPDVAQLRAGRPRVVVAIGEQSQGLPITAMAEALAQRLEIAPTPFPGDHMGFGPEAPAFAEALARAIRGDA